MLRSARRLAPFALLVIAGLSGCSAADEVAPSPTAGSQAEFQAASADWAEAYVVCARSFGADASVTQSGSITNPVAPGRDTRDGLDAGCIDELGEPPAAPPASRAMLLGLYTLLVEQADCLREHGYPVSEPPARDVWVDSYGAESWHPLSTLLAAGSSVSDAVALCQEPSAVEAERIGASLSATEAP